MKHALSSLNELLRIEAGGMPAVPAEVLNNADILVQPDSLTSLARSNNVNAPQVGTHSLASVGYSCASMSRNVSSGCIEEGYIQQPAVCCTSLPT